MLTSLLMFSGNRDLLGEVRIRTISQEYVVKVLDLIPDPSNKPEVKPREPLDLTLCTRCRQPWGFELVEQIEMWSCDNCGYEVREKSVDFFRMQLAEQESMMS